MVKIGLTLLISIIVWNVSAQATTIDYTIQSTVFGGERKISIFLPEAYEKQKAVAPFHVAYLLDGQFEPYFTITKGIIDYYAQSQQGIPLIVVAIHTQNRWDEFVPTCGDLQNDTIGAQRFTSFLAKEVIPTIDSMYSTSDFRLGIGHSLGGTYVLHELFKEQSLFDAAIAISPNLRVCDEQIIRQAANYLKNNPNNHKFIYTSIGTEGKVEKMFQPGVQQLDTICNSLTQKNWYWQSVQLDNCNHMTTFVPSINDAYLKISSKLMLLESDLIKMAEDSTQSFGEQMVQFYTQMAQFSKSNNEFSPKEAIAVLYKLAQLPYDGITIQYANFIAKRFNNSSFSSDERMEFDKDIVDVKNRAYFNQIIKQATNYKEQGNIKKASNLYEKAFELNVVRGTHYERMAAVSIFAQTGKIEAAFEQLDLLANKFKLDGHDFFISDETLLPLHQDKRWQQYMNQFVENSKLYR